MDLVAILIPCYNEAQTIAKVIKDCQDSLPEAKIYVYDNNSTDATYDIAKRAGAIVRRERKQGKGNVIRSMFREINAECYIMLDGDDTYPPKHMREMMHIILNDEADMVVGDRLSSTYFQENKRPFHNVGNIIVRKFINSLFGSNIRDIMTGYRAFSYEFVKTYPVLSKGFEVETEMTIHAVNHNMNVQNVKVDYRDRPVDSKSKLNTFSDGIKVMRTIFSLFKNYRPFRFFTIVSIILFLLAGVPFIFSVFIPYIQTGLVANFPTLIVCGVTALAALESFFTGLILDTEIRKHNQDFELYRHMVYYQFIQKKETRDGNIIE